MKVVKHDGIYKAARITGPSHNYLGLVVTPVAPSKIRCVQRTMPGDGVCEIDQIRLLEAVSEGVAMANSKTLKQLFVEQVEYVSSDTPDYEAYSELAKVIMCSASCDFL